MASETPLTNMVINTYESKEVYERLKEQGKLKDGEMHLINEEETSVFVVNFTSEKGEDELIWSADKTYSEIAAAYEDGIPILAYADGEQVSLSYVDDKDGAGFTSFEVTDRHIRSYEFCIGTDDVVSVDKTDFTYADKQDTLTFDTTPTEGSQNPVTSGGVYDAISQITPSTSSDTLIVKFTYSDDTKEYTCDKTFSEIMEAAVAGKTINAYDDGTPLELYYWSETKPENGIQFKYVDVDETRAYVTLITIDEQNNITVDDFESHDRTKQDVLVDSAVVGQTVRVKAVGLDGKPTEWEAVDFPTNNGEWVLINSVTLTAEDQIEILYFDKDLNGNSYEYDELYFCYNNGTAYNPETSATARATCHLFVNCSVARGDSTVTITNYLVSNAQQGNPVWFLPINKEAGNLTNQGGLFVLHPTGASRIQGYGLQPDSAKGKYSRFGIKPETSGLYLVGTFYLLGRNRQ